MTGRRVIRTVKQEEDMEKKKIHMIGNTHIDPVWLWKKVEGMQEVKSSFLSALERMKEFPEFLFTQSSISFLEWMKENCPEEFEEIRQRVLEGRWEIVGGMWVEPDCDIPSGEGMIRHFLYSQKFVMENFNQYVTTCYNVDSFGHGSNMPAICSGCNIRYYLMSRPDKKHVEVPPVFLWRSKDGSSVVAERTGGEYMAWTRPAIEWNLSESLEALEEYGYDRMAVFYGVGNHGGGPTIQNIRTICEMRQERDDLELDFSTIGNFFDSVETDRIPVVEGEMGRIYYGCYSSDCGIKTLNRMAEWTLLKAEILSCMAVLLGRKGFSYPQEKLERAWKQTLFNQFHDVLAGTSIEPARNAACRELSGAVSSAQDMIDSAIQAIANGIDTRGDGFPLLLVNPVGADFSGVFEASVYVPRAQKKNLRIRDFAGKEIPYAESGYHNDAPESRKVILFEAKVPAYGYALYRVISEGPDLKLEDEAIHADTETLDNGILRVVLDRRTGAPASIVKEGRELLEKPARFCVYEDDRGSWGEHVFDGKECGSFAVTDSRVVEANRMRAVVRVFLEYGKSEMMVDYILERNSDRLKVNIKLRNAEKQKLITWNIPVAVKDPVVYTETGFLAEDKVDCFGTNMEYYQHRFAQIEEKEDGSGIAVLNDCIYGFHQAGNEYRLILLRNSSFARGGRGPLKENLEGRFMNQGTFDYRIMLIPHEGAMTKKRLFEEADFLHMPVEYLGDSCHKGERLLCRDAALLLETQNMHVSVMKQSVYGTGELVVRVFETEGKKGHAVIKSKTAQTVVEAQPWQIKTVIQKAEGFTACNMLERQEEHNGNQESQDNG